ncbi:putative WRKY transcription factor, plant [Helianthus annuus]|nr:putative WRKY transcription factor, plant [Helianthus annuus]
MDNHHSPHSTTNATISDHRNPTAALRSTTCAKYKLMSPAQLPISRSTTITIPPGLSPSSFLDSPVLLTNIKVFHSLCNPTYFDYRNSASIRLLKTGPVLNRIFWSLNRKLIKIFQLRFYTSIENRTGPVLNRIFWSLNRKLIKIFQVLPYLSL